MNSRVNAITGLPDGYNAYHKVPIINHRNIGRLRLARQTLAENRIRFGSGRTFAFLSRLVPAKALIVTFHGANVKGRNDPYPRFERFRTFENSKAALMCIADPSVEKHRKDILLAWYTGDSTFDPMDMVDVAVDRAMTKVGASDVVFVGGSGGGYAALRAAMRRPGSAAFVESPRVNLHAAIPRTMDAYLSTFWPGHTLDDLQAKYPERFHLVRTLETGYRDQRIYYLQGLWDPHFLWHDYRLAKEALGVEGPYGSSPDGRVIFDLFAGARPTHGPPPAALFQQHWNQAMRRFGIDALLPAPSKSHS